MTTLSEKYMNMILEDIENDLVSSMELLDNEKIAKLIYKDGTQHLMGDPEDLEKYTVGMKTECTFGKDNEITMGYCCGYCGKILSKKRKCSRCGDMLYCSRKCQKKDWKHHRATCKKR